MIVQPSPWRNVWVQRSTYERPGGNQAQVHRAGGMRSPSSGPDVGDVLEDSCARGTAIRGVPRPLERYFSYLGQCRSHRGGRRRFQPTSHS